ncbi:Serpentine receptor class r-10 [Caenorhabditis elegans]|uniref:Serpentine receptor class r-10 n=1 Tax=Caenorhabditis elegans TaxID=6239 RepID=O45284_CAEEL|nr:Seven TM Receptor [Caenorhabditis elegans]CAB05691.1 Seven TM Receptor [Caenorhabditis elegans]|eukprot:NP_507122.1 Seven TM Receptor [Caenorhabditis elegans]
MASWKQLQDNIQIMGAGVALFLNCILINIITKHSPKEIGDYKYLMLFISCFEITYSLLDVLVQPMFHSFQATFVLIVDTSMSKIDKLFWQTFAFIYADFFASTMAIFSIHFAYRYWAISGVNENMLKWFRRPRIFIWLLAPCLFSAIWTIDITAGCLPRKSSNDYLRDSMSERLGLNVSEIVYFAPYFYEFNENGEKEIFWPALAALFLNSSTIIISLVFSIYYGVKCWRRMHAIFSSSSSQFQNIHSQLFYALVAQTMIPVFLMHIPVLTMFIFSLMEIDAGSFSSIVSMTIALFPTLDPLPTMIIVSQYRNVIKNYFISRFKKFRNSKCGKFLKRKKKRVNRNTAVVLQS